MFRIYSADLLQAIYRYFGGVVEHRYYDMINWKAGSEETRTADEIKKHICDGLRRLSQED